MRSPLAWALRIVREVKGEIKAGLIIQDRIVQNQQFSIWCKLAMAEEPLFSDNSPSEGWKQAGEEDEFEGAQGEKEEMNRTFGQAVSATRCPAWDKSRCTWSETVRCGNRGGDILSLLFLFKVFFYCI